MIRPRAIAFVLALLLAGCVHERTKSLPTYAAGSLHPGGPIRLGSDPKQGNPPATAVPTPVPAAAPAFESPAAVLSRADPGAPAGTGLRATTPPPARPEREVVAARATVYVPAARAGEVSLTGAAVEADGAGRRTVTGNAVLRLGDLTVRAERLTLVVKKPGDADLQVSARGSVSYRSEKGDARVEETGLKSLLLTNDEYVPLR